MKNRPYAWALKSGVAQDAVTLEAVSRPSVTAAYPDVLVREGRQAAHDHVPPIDACQLSRRSAQDEIDHPGRGRSELAGADVRHGLHDVHAA